MPPPPCLRGFDDVLTAVDAIFSLQECLGDVKNIRELDLFLRGTSDVYGILLDMYNVTQDLLEQIRLLPRDICARRANSVA
jgi:hypothetical protein